MPGPPCQCPSTPLWSCEDACQAGCRSRPTIWSVHCWSKQQVLPYGCSFFCCIVLPETCPSSARAQKLPGLFSLRGFGPSWLQERTANAACVCSFQSHVSSGGQLHMCTPPTARDVLLLVARQYPAAALTVKIFNLLRVPVWASHPSCERFQLCECTAMRCSVVSMAAVLKCVKYV